MPSEPQNGYMYVRAEYPLAVQHLKIAIAQAEELGLIGRQHPGHGFQLPCEDQGGRRRLCLRRRDRPSGLHRREAGDAPRPAALPGHCRTLGQAHEHQQRGDLCQHPLHHPRRCGGLCGRGTARRARAPRSSPSRARSTTPAWWRFPWGRPCARSSYEDRRRDPPRPSLQGGTDGRAFGWVPAAAKYLDLPIDYESLTQAGSMMGSGGMIVMDEKTCMVDIARFFLSFTQDESCGKCVPCRIGTKRMLEILTRITKGEGQGRGYRAPPGDGPDHQRCLPLRPGPDLSQPGALDDQAFPGRVRGPHPDKQCPAGVCEALTFAPCENTCPVRCDAVGYTALISAGRYEEALSPDPLDQAPGRDLRPGLQPSLREDVQAGGDR